MRRCTRREFLSDSALAAAVVALPVGNLLAADVNKEDPSKKHSGELLHVAVVGVHGRGNEHIVEYLKNPHVEITCVVDVDEKIGRQRAQWIGKQQGHEPTSVRDIRQMLDDKSVDIVSIATPALSSCRC